MPHKSYRSYRARPNRLGTRGRAGLTTVAGLTVTGLALAGLVGCSSSSGGNGHASSEGPHSPSSVNPGGPNAAGSGSSSASGSGGSGSGSGGSPATATALAARIRSALLAVHSAHVDFSSKISGLTTTGSGDETLAGGKLSGAHVTDSIASVGATEVIYAGGTFYIKLPGSLNKSGRPWQVPSAHSADPALRALAKTVDSQLGSASVAGLAEIAKAASSLHVVGQEQVSGALATHYKIVIDVARLPADNAIRQTIQSLGVKTIPADLWIDGRGRLAKIVQNLTIDGKPSTNTVTISKYDAPVIITAPPDSQVAR